LFVSSRADASAAEVATSVGRHDEARQALAGYRIVLDLLVAEHFGLLHDEDQWQLAAKVEALAPCRDRRFFHWEIEFPEVFFGFLDADKRRIEHKGKIREGSAGFDCVVGNPPYVRMESIKPIKPFLKTNYICHAERADLFIYFYERAMRLLRSQGRTGFIASSTWTKTKAGERLREFLKKNHTLVSFLDFGDLPVFQDATTYPCILVVQHGRPAPRHEVQAAVVRDLEQTKSDKLFTSGVPVAQAALDPAGWRLKDRRLTGLFDKIRAQGVSLKEYCGSPLRGVVSGLNEAFVISNDQRDGLVNEEPWSKDILKPFLLGRDLKPWRYAWRGLWLIYAHRGIDIKKYSAILAHLRTFKPRLEARATSNHHA
jgi:hypothetical protein